jgi:hypothetical protein
MATEAGAAGRSLLHPRHCKMAANAVAAAQIAQICAIAGTVCSAPDAFGRAGVEHCPALRTARVRAIGQRAGGSVPAIAFGLHAARRDEAQRGRIDAVPKPGRFRAIVEHVPQMRIAVA